MRKLTAVVGFLFVVCGAWKVAFAQTDTCQLNLLVDKSTGIVWQSGSCAVGQACPFPYSGSCQSGTWVEQHSGVSWSYCRCSGSTGCFNGFTPYEPGGQQGQAKCLPFLCVSPSGECRYHEATTGDPEVNKVDCICWSMPP